MDSQKLTEKLIFGSVWAIAVELITGAARAGSYFCYARYLSPSDFGLIAFCVLLVNLFALVVDNGVGLALIRVEQEDAQVYTAGFYINVGISLVSVLLLSITAKWGWQLLHDRRVILILPILSLQLPFNALCSVHIAVARRRFQYRKLVPIRLISTACSLAVGLYIAISERTYWALVAASVTAAIAQMIAAWTVLEWRPSIGINWSAALAVLRFTSWVSLDMVVTWLVMSGGGLFLAAFLGAHDLGLYRLSDQLDAYLMGSVMSPLVPVLYSAFCEVGREQGSWRTIFVRSSRAVVLGAFALAGAIAVMAHPLEGLIGKKWNGVASIILINAVADAFAYATISIPPLMRSQGKVKVVATLRILMVLGQVGVYSLVIRHGLKDFLFGKLGIEVATAVVSYFAVRALFGIRLWELVRQQFPSVFVIACCTVAGVLVAGFGTPLGRVVGLMLGLVAFSIPLSTYLLLFERPLLFRAINVVVRR